MSVAVASPPRKPAVVKWAAITSVSSVVALGVVAGLLIRGDDQVDSTGGGAAPSFSLPDVNDPAVQVSLAAGEPVVLYFFASWCIPCRRELPVVQAIHAERDDVTVVGVNHQDHRDDAREFMARYGASFPAAHDPGASIALDYRVRALPVTVFIDRDGRIDSTVYGEVDRAELDRRIDALVLQGSQD